jgi:hypothetical protein
MPDRIVRDELLTSERYWSVSIEAQRLFVHLLLAVDDMGRFSGKNFTIRSACFPGQSVQPEKVEKMLTELHDEDLVRLYSVGGERFVFIPRFGQRLRYKNSKFPAPPKEINDIEEAKTDLRPTAVMPKPDSSLQKRSEEKRSEEKERGAKRPTFTPPTLDEIRAFIKEHRLSVDASKFFYHYESNGWMVGKAKLKSWQSAVHRWHHSEDRKPQQDSIPYI